MDVGRIGAQADVLTDGDPGRRPHHRNGAASGRPLGGNARLVRYRGAAVRLVGLALSEQAGEKLRRLVEEHGRLTLQTRVDLRRCLGTHDVDVRLHRDVSAQIQVEVVPIGVERIEEPAASDAEVNAQQ